MSKFGNGEVFNNCWTDLYGINETLDEICGSLLSIEWLDFIDKLLEVDSKVKGEYDRG